MNKKQWLLLGFLIIVSTVLGQYFLHHTNLNWGWHFEIPAWFTAWLFLFFVLKRNWWYSIAAVILVSITEDALFLLWDRIEGRTSWITPFYSHDWIPLCQNWGGIPSHYFYSLLIAGVLILIGYRRYKWSLNSVQK